MGVYRTEYIIYGWKLPYDIGKDQELDLYEIDEILESPFSLIVDGMMGKYCVFGEIINQTSDEGWEFTILDLEKMDSQKLIDKYKEIFKLNSEEIVTDPYLFVFTHYS